MRPMVSSTASSPSEIRLFDGSGSRVNRVHVFDSRTGSYVTRGFTRGSTLFVRRPVELASVTIRTFDGRPRGQSRVAAHTARSAATAASPLHSAPHPAAVPPECRPMEDRS